MDYEDEAILIDTADNTGTGRLPRLWDAIKYDFSRKYFTDIWMNTPLEVRFRLTNQCDERCAHCFECSGPENPATHMSPADVAFYQRAIPPATGIALTGGEWSLVYKSAPHYLRDIFNLLDMSRGNEISIQTNARWVGGANHDNIMGDLREISRRVGRAGGVLRLCTSVDRYRSDAAINGVRDLVRDVAADGGFGDTKLVIMSDRLDYRLANERVLNPEYFAAHGVNLRFEPRTPFNPFFQVCHANKTRVVVHEEFPPMRIGRAAQNNLGYEIVSPEQQCAGLAGDVREMSLSFREDGYCKWHDYYDWNIMTPYRDASGEYKPLGQIRAELIDMAWRRRLPVNLRNALMCAIPIVGPLILEKRRRDIKRSFEAHSARVQWVAYDINNIREI